MAVSLRVPDAVAVALLHEPENRVLAANDTFVKWTGVPRRRLIGATLRQLHLVMTGYEEAGENEVFESGWRLPTGGMRVTFSKKHFSGSEDERLVVLLSVDVTQEMTAAAATPMIRRAERAQVGRVFHDTVAQEIGAVGFLTQILKRGEWPEEAKAHLARLEDAVRKCTEAGAAFAAGLKERPPKV